jgi:hypothetical protein
MTAPRALGLIERGLAGRAAVAVVGLLSFLAFAWLWGSLRPLPWVYDEAAYLLQAKIFATGSWTAPGRPLPEFFEQVHVFVTPKLVPKYPPGHALLLVPGVWLGAPAVMPLLFGAVTGALLFWWARRLFNPWVGLLAWAIWITAPDELFIRPSYLSQSSSTVLWMAAWGLLARWRHAGGGWLLAGFAVAAAFAAITRPITAAAFLVPTGIWILGELRRTGRWRQLGPAFAAGLPILVLPLWWSRAASGHVFPTPYSEYSRIYQPWDMPGFTASHAAPLRPPIPALERLKREQLPTYQAHTIERLPSILVERLQGIAGKFWGLRGLWEPTGLRWLLVPLAAVGLFALTGPGWFLIANTVSLVLCYLWMPASPVWTVYYREIFPVLALLTAVGTWRVARWIGERVTRVRSALAPEGVAAGLCLVGLAVAVPGVVDRFEMAKDWQFRLRVDGQNLRKVIGAIPGPAILFVSSGPPNQPYESLVWNEPDLGSTRVWVVHDRGEDNARLVRLAPERRAYRYDPGNPRRVAPWRPALPLPPRRPSSLDSPDGLLGPVGHQLLPEGDGGLFGDDVEAVDGGLLGDDSLIEAHRAGIHRHHQGGDPVAVVEPLVGRLDHLELLVHVLDHLVVLIELGDVSGHRLPLPPGGKGGGGRLEPGLIAAAVPDQDHLGEPVRLIAAGDIVEQAPIGRFPQADRSRIPHVSGPGLDVALRYEGDDGSAERVA